MTQPRALSFDLDDTLRDGRGAAEALRRTAEHLSVLSGVATNDLLAANASEWAGLWPEVEAAWELGEMSGETVTTEAWRRTLAVCDVANSGRPVHRMAPRNDSEGPSRHPPRGRSLWPRSSSPLDSAHGIATGADFALCDWNPAGDCH